MLDLHLIELQDKDFSRALKLAWDNKYPQSFRQVIEHLQQDQFASVTIALTDLVSAFSKEQLRLAFCMMRDWNTNAQHAEQAQAILHSIFLCHPPEVGCCSDHCFPCLTGLLQSFSEIMHGVAGACRGVSTGRCA